MTRLSLRIDLADGGRIGPGKIRLLEEIAAAGSISAGARRLEMSYKRAWDLVEEMNRLFAEPVISTQTGGRKGGGARLTLTGQALIERFRAIEKAAGKAAGPHLKVIEALREPSR